MPSLHTQEGATEEPAIVDPPAPSLPSLRSLDLDVADFWCHSMLQQPLESNLEVSFEALEKIIPRLTPLNTHYDDGDSDSEDEDMAGDNAKHKGEITEIEAALSLRMRLLEVLQGVLTLEFEEDAENDEYLVFPNPSKTAEDFSNARNRLQVLFEKIHARRKQSSDNNDDGYHRLRRSLLALEEIMDSEASLDLLKQASPSNPSQPTLVSKSPPATKAEWLDELSEMMKMLTKTFLDDHVPVPDALASVASFVLQLVTTRQMRHEESPPSPSPLTQDSALIDHHNSHDIDDDVSDEDIARVQRGLQNLYGRPASPFHIVRLREDVRKLLLKWSTQDIQLPRLVQLGYLTGKPITSNAVQPSASTKSSSETAAQVNGVDAEVQTEPVRATSDEAMSTTKKNQDVARPPPKEDLKESHPDSDSETTFGDTHRNRKQAAQTTEIVHQVWGSSNKRRKAGGIVMDDDDEKENSPVAKKIIRRRNPPRGDPPAPRASLAGRMRASPRTNRSNLKPPPVYPSQKKPSPSPKKSTNKTLLGRLSTDEEEEDDRKPKAKETIKPPAKSRRGSDPKEEFRVKTNRKRSSGNKKRARSQEPAVTEKPARKKQKKFKPTEADILEAIRKGVDTYGYGNWTMIKKRSGGVLKHLSGSQIKEQAEALTALAV